MKQSKTKKKPLLLVLLHRLTENRKAFIVFLVLMVLTVAALIRSIVLAQWENVLLALLTLVLFLIPPLFENNFHIKLPTTLEILAFCFAFCAEVLGEIGCFYVNIPGWDTILHTLSGFMFAAFGFCLADIFNRGKFRFQLSPVYMAIVAFCFSMTTGVLWEFIEFFIDRSLGMDMQKDTLLQGIISVTFDKTNSNIPIHMDNITQTIICMEDGSQYIIQGGYLDVGLFDTMKDLLVNFAGALVFSIFGFFYVKQKGKGKVASQFIPVYVGKEEDADHAALPEAEAVTKDAPTADNRDA